MRSAPTSILEARLYPVIITSFFIHSELSALIDIIISPILMQVTCQNLYIYILFIMNRLSI